MMCSLTFLQRHHPDGQHFIDHIVTRDKTWLYHFVSTSKEANMEKKHPRSPMTKKFKVTSSAGKVVATIFMWCYPDRLPVACPEHQRRSLSCHFDKVMLSHPTQTAGMLNEGVILLQDNAKPHTTQGELGKYGD
ncbi:histone-lysine N-methyltransferase SETMAR [Trichonephila clavata]|uniref:Histone-lysine N-methyltransferase SETMAR n=1 Tax=Trichonephila clavata TaxID=2740835 RepID=A0A8X6FE65_TRICU|nr:histone-lysine N-methyltransferase SETMAR [Trichonephila clavata]